MSTYKFRIYHDNSQIIKLDLTCSNRIYKCNYCDLATGRNLNTAIKIKNIGLQKVGKGVPDFRPVDIVSLLQSKHTG
jgi:hypothetical protein